MGDVDPGRLVGQPPSGGRRGDVDGPENQGLGLRDAPVAGGDRRRSQLFATQGHPIVQVDELGAVVDFEIGEREGQAAAPQQRRQEPLTAEPGELFDERLKSGETRTDQQRSGLSCRPSPLVDPRKPEQPPSGSAFAGPLVPREAAIEDHAREGG